MLTQFFSQSPPKEGDLYKEITIRGKTFQLFYGFYEPFERESRDSEPMPIYPDFLKNPVFTDEGVPFVTAMQDVCKRFRGKADSDSCADCEHFLSCEELFGLCTCPEGKPTSAIKGVVQNE